MERIPWNERTPAIEPDSGDDMDAKILMKLSSTPSWTWPEDAGSILLETLNATSHGASDAQAQEARMLAIELAGEAGVMDDAMATALLAIISSNDESSRARERAALSLGPILEYIDMECVDDIAEQIGLPSEDDLPISVTVFRRIQDVLRSVYLDAHASQGVRRCALEASVRAPQDWHRDAVRAAYFSGDDDWRSTAVFAMHWIQGFDEQIMETLEDEDEQMQLLAIHAAGGSEVSQAWPVVAGILRGDSPSKELLLAAIEAAPGINAAEAAALLGELADSDDQEVAEAALEAIGDSRALALDPSDTAGVEELLGLVDAGELEDDPDDDQDPGR